MAVIKRDAARAAAVWSVVFAIPHVYWAVGGTAGLPAGEPLQGALAVINLVAIVSSGVAAALAVALARESTTPLPRQVVIAAAYVAAMVLGLRGAVGIAQSLVDGVRSSDGPRPLIVGFELLFLIGGILFGVAGTEYARRTRERRRAQSG